MAGGRVGSGEPGAPSTVFRVPARLADPCRQKDGGSGLYFAFAELKGPAKFTNCASRFRAVDLLSSKFLKLVWRVAYNKDDKEISPKKPFWFPRSAAELAADSVTRLL